MEWDKTLVWNRVYEPRQPQDLLRGFPDDSSVENPRPPGVTTFIGPLVTTINATQAAGDTSLTLLDNTRMIDGDRVAIILDNGDMFRTTIASVASDGVTVTISTPLPSATSAGKTVTDESAISSATIE